jgi:hypothetical protein
MHLKPSEAQSLVRDYEGSPFFLRTSMYETAFFGDATKKLLTAVPPEQVRLLENPDGTSLSPGSIERIVKFGTAVRVQKIEFPFAATPLERVLLSPRSLAWVYVVLASDPKNALPRIVVLRPGIEDESAARVELDRFVSKEPLTGLIEEFPEAFRIALETKRVVVGMTAQMVEMAWGYPESKNIAFEGEKSIELWRWAGKRRSVKLVDARVVEFVE